MDTVTCFSMNGTHLLNGSAGFSMLNNKQRRTTIHPGNDSLIGTCGGVSHHQ